MLCCSCKLIIDHLNSCKCLISDTVSASLLLLFSAQGGGDVGKYTCLLCKKEFNSESGVKYHISKTHSQVKQTLNLCTVCLANEAEHPS